MLARHSLNPLSPCSDIPLSGDDQVEIRVASVQQAKKRAPCERAAPLAHLHRYRERVASFVVAGERTALNRRIGPLGVLVF